MIGLHLPTLGRTVSLYEPPQLKALGPVIERARQRSGPDQQVPETAIVTGARGLVRQAGIRNITLIGGSYQCINGLILTIGFGLLMRTFVSLNSPLQISPPQFLREFFYVPNMHGVDWKAIRERYAPLVEHVHHRADLNYVIGEMIGELKSESNRSKDMTSLPNRMSA